MRGVDRYTVSKLMGHHSTETTVRYAHRGPNYPRESANALVSDEENGTRTGTSQTTLSVNHCGPVAQKDRAAVS